MTQAVSVRTIRPAESRLIAAVCGAHFMSHYYMLLLAPLFVFVRGDFKVSYTELALALTVFNVVSGILQTPVGFLVDRIGARMVLIVGLAVSTVAYAIAGLADSYWVFIAMYGLGGLGNTVFHPADYSLLSHHAPKERLGQVFAFHTFAGIVGSAIAPVTLLFMQAYFGWRGAYVGAINRAKFCVENYDGAPAVRGSMKVLVDAYRQLKMTDLAADAERVYSANYPGSTKDIEQKKSWWRRIL